MSEHHVTVTVQAPVHQVYTFFTHFNDFPKFMSFIKEVTYYDEQRSHWVAQVAGTHEWDAVNEDWIPDQQIGWRSTRGLQNTGRVKFTPLNAQTTQLDVYISYTPPAGALGAVADQLGFDGNFDTVLQRDLEHFAHMVEQAPPGALDPMQSHYLFHQESAVAKGAITQQQEASMRHDPMMHPQALQERETAIAQAQAQTHASEQERVAAQEHFLAQQQQTTQAQEETLRRQAELDQQVAQASALTEQEQLTATTEPHPIYDTLGGRHAAIERLAFGDQDAQSHRFPQHEQDPMISRAPGKARHPSGVPLSEVEVESPWNTAIRGRYDPSEDDAPTPQSPAQPQQPTHSEDQI